MSSSRRDIINEQLTIAVREIMEQLPTMTLVYRNPNYDLNATVANEADFFLDAVLGEIMERCAVKLLNRQISPTDEEFSRIHLSVFTPAPQFKNAIRNIIGL